MLILLLSWIMVGCVYFWAQIKKERKRDDAC